LIHIERYSDRRKADFERLNREWIEHHFSIEPEDLRLFADPRGEIVDRGGEIFFAIDTGASVPGGTGGGEAVGTVTMIEHAPHAFELAKMGVTPVYKGRGVGRLLMNAAIEFARERGKREIVLLTNSSLAPALRLYESVGFERMPHVADNRFARVDLEMVLRLDD
jgi:GNAT superfamily N-acetyltransferase